MSAIQEKRITGALEPAGAEIHRGSGALSASPPSPIEVWTCNTGDLLLTVIKMNNTIWGPPLPLEDPVVAGKFSEAFAHLPCFEELKTCISNSGMTPCEAYQRLYGTQENMEGYLDGQPRLPQQVQQIFERDLFRYAPSLKGDVKHQEPTFWSGMVGLELGSPPTFLGRIANGAGDAEGYSESGMFLTHEVRGRGMGRCAFHALLLHALVGHLQNFPVREKPLTYFSATISPNNPRAEEISKLIERINTAAGKVLIHADQVQRTYGKRTFISVHASNIESVVRAILPNLDTQLKVNGVPFTVFRDEQQPCASGG